MAGPDSSPRKLEATEDFLQRFTANQRRVYLFILALVSRPADAEEILQETNLVLWRKSGQFAAGSDFTAWAFQIARYEVLKFRERQRRGAGSQPLSDEVIERLAEDAISQVELLEHRRHALGDCLQKLSAKDRDLVERRNRPGMTIAKVAGEVGRPAGGLYKAFERIYRALHVCIDSSMTEEGGR